ncbi:MAG: TIGR04552 family protein [Oligoflexia bacterium]
MAFNRRYDIRWETLDIIVRGKSAIDASTGFQLKSLDDVERFLLGYGFDLTNPIEKAELFGNFHEALNFVRKNFLSPENPDGLKLEVPRKIVELVDVRELFLMASLSAPGQNNDPSGKLIRDFACAVLKVIHTIAHIDKDLRTHYFAECQKQILDRFYRVLHRDADGKLFLGEGDDRIELVAFESKPKKSRDSTLLKLLHKPENVAEDIFDRVGLRFVTHTPLDTIRVIKFLKDHMILMPPNIKPSRSRNSLIDLDRFEGCWREALGRWESREWTDEQAEQFLATGAVYPEQDPDNPHSSKFYRAIQFTSRQLIKFRNPLHDEIRELKAHVKTMSGDHESTAARTLMDRIERIDSKHVPREFRFFYPFEVQLMDRVSAEENERGRSAHSEYKKAQVQTALKRVMGALVDFGRA